MRISIRRADVQTSDVRHRVPRRAVCGALLMLLSGAGCGTQPRASSPTPRVQPATGAPSVPTTDAATTPTAGLQSAPIIRAAWADVGVLTPFRVSTAGPGGAVMLTLLYDTLTWKDEHGTIPWLASGWEAAPDGRSYTFTLAAGARWHDGQPLTADDVAFSFDYYARHPFRWMSTAMVEGADVLTPTNVRVRVTQPYAPFLDDIAGVLPIIPKHIWSRVEDPNTYDATDASVGSGPFTLAEYRSAEGAYRLKANPAYFKGKVIVREYQQLNTPAETTIQALQQGQLDLALATDASVADVFKDNPKVKVFETQPLSVVRLAVNTERAPLDNVEVRQAIAYALDRAKIAQTITKEAPVIAGVGAVPPESPWFNPAIHAYPLDVEKARSLLHGQQLTVELLADPSSREPDLMQPMLRTVGITLVTRRVDSKTRTQLLREKNFQLGLVQHIGVGADPDFLRRWYANEEANDFAQGSVFQNARYTQLGRDEATMLDPAKRKELVAAMQAIIADELPTIVLYHRRFSWVYDSTKLTPMHTSGGLINGAPLIQNKLTFLQR